MQVLKTWEVLGIFNVNTLREIRQALPPQFHELEIICITPEYMAKCEALRHSW